MSGFNLRRKPRISYYEPEEPNLDEYVYCENCGDFVFEYCAIHGPLLVIPDTKVPTKTEYPSFVPRAALTIPQVFLHIAPSIIPDGWRGQRRQQQPRQQRWRLHASSVPDGGQVQRHPQQQRQRQLNQSWQQRHASTDGGAGLGIFSTLTLPRGVRFGPYRGRKTDEITSTYCWQLYSENRKRRIVVDAEDANSSNWMRYVNCARHWCEQNLIAYQYRGDIYYRTIKIIPKFTELMVFYGSEFANLLGVDLRKYNSPAGYAAKYGAPWAKKSKITGASTHNKAVLTLEKKKLEKEQMNKNTEIEKFERSNSTLNTQKEEPTTIQNNIQDINNNKPGCSNIKNTINNNVSSNIQHFICNDCGKSFDNRSVLSEHIERHAIESGDHNCQLCKYQGTTIQCLENHMKYHLPNVTRETPERGTICKQRISKKRNTSLRTHTEQKLFECTMCKNRCNQKSHLKIHLRTHTGEKLFECSICKYRCNRESGLKIHLRTHTGEKPFECTICKYRCNQKSNLKPHLRTHTGEKPFECTICKYRCNEKSVLKRHLRTHTGEKPFECSICKYMCNEKSYLKRHLRTHTGEKPFECSICKYMCNEKSYLKRHLRTHTGEKPFECSMCKYRCNQKSDLKIHLRTHTGEKPFECSICKYRCNRKSDLKIHLRTHTGEKPFECSICKYRCNCKRNLKTHLRTHTGEKPFECSICKYRCNCKRNLKTHLRTHTGEKPFECSMCKFRGNTKSHLKRHLKTHTGEKPFECSICKHRFLSKGNLKSHLTTHSHV